MPELLTNAWGIIQVILGFGFIIFIHELGHFMVAKKVGIRVEKFSIGFGPKLWSITRGGTEYVLSIIPLGGFVKMAGESPEERADSEGEPVPVHEVVGDEFFAKSIPARSAVIVAGSLMNFLIAFPMCILFYLLVGAADPMESYVGDIRPGSLAFAAGVRYGDKIVEMNGNPVASWLDLSDGLMDAMTSDEDQVRLKIQRGEQTREVVITYPPGATDIRERMRILGLNAHNYVAGTRLSQAAPISKQAPAYGLLEPGDEITHVNGERVLQWNELTQRVHASAGKELTLGVMRNGEPREVKVVPKKAGTFKWVPLVLDLKTYQQPRIGYVREGTPAYGVLQVGDEITHVNDRPVTTWQEVLENIRSIDKTVTFTLKGKDEPVVIEQGPGLRLVDSVGIAPVAGLYAARDYPDKEIRRGDRLMKIEGRDLSEGRSRSRMEMASPIYWPRDLYEGLLLSKDEEETVEMTFSRDGEPYNVKIGYVPREEGIIDVQPFQTVVHIERGPLWAVGMGLSKPFEMIGMMGRTFKLLFRGRASADELAGPLGILTMSYKKATEGGFVQLLWFLTFISINLSIVNMLPIPVLDGGHILFLVIEALKGKPLSEKSLIRAQYVGLILLLSLMLFATFNDIRDISWIRRLF